MSGLFIVIEGPDGVGKSTVVKALEKKINETMKYSSCITTTEPTKTETGMEIRRVLSSDDPAEQARLLELYLQDRAEHNRDFIDPMLEDYDFVISDRYKHSTIVYQSIQNLNYVTKLVGLNAKFRVPDITFVLFDTPTKLLARMDNREESKEFLETEDILNKSIVLYMNMHNILKGEKIVYIYNSSLEDTVSRIFWYIFKK